MFTSAVIPSPSLEIRNQLKREYDYQFADLRTRLFDQYQQQLQNASSHSAGLDQSIGEQVREQVRLAQQFERDDDERRQHLLQQSTDSEEVKRLVNKLHREGKDTTHFDRILDAVSLQLNATPENKSMSKVKPFNGHQI